MHSWLLRDEFVQDEPNLVQRRWGMLGEHVHLDMVGTIRWDAPPITTRDDESSYERWIDNVYDVPTMYA
jgi:hypothetical protein